MKTTPKLRWTLVSVVVVLAAFGVGALLAPPASGEGDTDLQALAAKYIGYESSIRLTPAQEQIKKEALEAIPAPCCSDNTMYTCCCPCNLARAVWGLSAYLITEKGAGVAQVRKSAEEWIAKIGPQGFSGDVCYTGGCGRPMSQNGCGGMSPSQLSL